MADAQLTAPVYDTIGRQYARRRRPDPRWAATIRQAIGGAGTVVNVGAGTGSYEPADLNVVAVEPSRVMIGQRPAAAAPVARARAERLPFPDRSFDVAMAVLTVHHWEDWRTGVAELQRVSRRQVLLVFDPKQTQRFWLVADYLPEAATLDHGRAPSIDELLTALGPATSVPLPVPADMTDGVLAAHWRRPHAYLDPAVRSSASTFAQLPPEVVARATRHLRQDLTAGTWHQRHGHLQQRAEHDAGYRLITTEE